MIFMLYLQKDRIESSYFYFRVFGLATFRGPFFCMHPKLIKFFRAALPASPLVEDTFALQQEALKRGFILNPQVLGEDVKEFLKTEAINPNSTFYKTWEDVVSKDRISLLMDQILHYASTYGTRRTGIPYIPPGEAQAPDFNKYTYIDVISEEALFARCRDMLYSGIALKSETVRLLCDAIKQGLRKGVGEIDIDAVRNREGQAVLCKILDRHPSDPVGLLRYIVYVATFETLLIRSKYLLASIERGAKKFDFTTLSEKELEKLASIFYRFKPLFLAFKSRASSPNRAVINRIRRMAPRFHRPMEPGFWTSLLGTRPPLESVAAKLSEPNSFKLVSLLQCVRERILMSDQKHPRQMYLIRNGKLFVAPPKFSFDAPTLEYYSSLAQMLEAELVRRLSAKACLVRFPAELHLACPTSEKNFIGNLPFGSYYPMKGHNFFGIYWRNEWGTFDFDLSFINWNGVKIGWNEHYNTGDTVYSGDLTDANPEASEIIYCKDICPDGTIMCNRYDGISGSRFRFFFGQEDIVDLKAGYMVRPDSIVVSEDLTSDSAEKMLGIVCGARIFLMDLGAGEHQVSVAAHPGEKELIMARKALSFIDLKDLLLKAGFTESDMPDLDLSTLTKDTLITLFS